MTTSTITKIQNGTIVLPKAIRKLWKEAEVFISGEKDTILIKRLQAPSFTKMLDEFQKIGRDISKKDVKEAIDWIGRKETIKS